MTISDVVSRFDSLEQSLKSVFPKVDPRTVVGLIIREKKQKDPLYTVEFQFPSSIVLTVLQLFFVYLQY